MTGDDVIVGHITVKHSFCLTFKAEMNFNYTEYHIGACLYPVELVLRRSHNFFFGDRFSFPLRVALCLLGKVRAV